MGARLQPAAEGDDVETAPSLPKLGPLADILGFHLARATVDTYDAFERYIGKPFILKKAEFSLLMVVTANAAITPKRLARTLAVTPPKLTMLLDGLQDRGLIRRERSPLDGRSQNVVLTAKGEKMARDSTTAATKMERELMTRLTRAEHAMLIELLSKLAGQRPV